MKRIHEGTIELYDDLITGVQLLSPNGANRPPGKAGPIAECLSLFCVRFFKFKRRGLWGMRSILMAPRAVRFENLECKSRSVQLVLNPYRHYLRLID